MVNIIILDFFEHLKLSVCLNDKFQFVEQFNMYQPYSEKSEYGFFIATMIELLGWIWYNIKKSDKPINLKFIEVMYEICKGRGKNRRGENIYFYP